MFDQRCVPTHYGYGQGSHADCQQKFSCGMRHCLPPGGRIVPTWGELHVNGQRVVLEVIDFQQLSGTQSGAGATPMSPH